MSVMAFGGARCYFSEFKDNITLSTLYTERSERKKGHATALLSVCTKKADEIGKPIRLYVGPFDNRPMCEADLTRMYEKAGFVIDEVSRFGTIFMTYHPKVANENLGDVHQDGTGMA